MTTRVTVWGTSPAKFVVVDPAATAGAVVGVNLTWPDGTLVDLSDVSGPSASGSTVTGVLSVASAIDGSGDTVVNLVGDGDPAPLEYYGTGAGGLRGYQSVSVNIASAGHASTDKPVPAGSDELMLLDSASGFALTKTTVSQLLSGLGLDSLITQAGDAFMTEDTADLLVA